MEKLLIKNNGTLVKTTWVYNDLKEEGYYEDQDVSDISSMYIHDVCEIDNDVTLYDILLLINRNITYYDAVLNNWTKDLVYEGLFGEKQKDEFNRDIDYLEIYRHLENIKDENKFKLEGFDVPQFHAISKVLDKDDKNGFKAGDRIPYSVSFLSVADLANLPIKLNHKVDLYEMDYSSDRLKSEIKYTFDYIPFKLLDILYAIVWELSFYGPPSKRDAKGKELLEIVDEIKKEEKKLTND